MTSSNTAGRLIVRVFLSGAVLVGLALSRNGLSKTVYFERTPAAVSGARAGNLLLAVGRAVLIMCAAFVFSTGPRWAAAAIAAPAVICGGLAMTASGTFLPQIAALPTFALAVAGAVGVLAERGMGEVDPSRTHLLRRGSQREQLVALGFCVLPDRR